MEARDVDWFVPLTLIMLVELGLSRSFSIAALFPTYSLMSLVAVIVFAFGAVMRTLYVFYREGESRPVVRLAKALSTNRTRIAFLFGGLVVVTVNACCLTALKFGMQKVVPFYADPALASFDRMIFGQDAWRWTNAVFGWAFAPVSALYGTWLLGQIGLLSILLFSPPSKLKTQALIARSLMWFLLGTVLAYALSSAGPIFYDQVYGGTQFSGLRAMLERSPFTAGAEDYLWNARRSGNLQFASGISAMPSLHVAGATWLALVTSAAFPRLKPIAWAYVALIYLGSLMTGWHYSLDGMVGITCVLLIWKASGRLAAWRGYTPVGAPRMAGAAREMVNS